MPHSENAPFSDNTLREIEADFHARPDYARVETAPAMITMPSELEFQQQAAEREAREAAERERRSLATKEWLEREKRQKRKSRLKKAMAVAAVVMTFKSGGFIDMAGDQFSDAGRVASEAIETPKTSDYLSDSVDGIDFEEYPEAAQADMRAEAHEEMQRDERVREAIIGLFETVDSDGYEGVKAEVAAERSAHPELFMSEERLNAVVDNIENAGSNSDTLESLGEFLAFYGIETGFRDDQKFEGREGEVKEIARAWVDVLSVLPKDFVALAELERVTISDEAVSGQDGHGSEMGTYTPDSNEINIVAKSRLLNAMAPAEGFLQRSDFSYEGVIAHEFGHALDERMPIGASLEEGEEMDTMSVKAIAEHIGRGIINRPEAPSIYAHSSDQEYAAELLSGVLSDRSDGLATTDEWRKFGSTSNKKMIDMLAQLEAVRPGIAKILIANRA